MSKRVTMKDVARRAGVSTATVSRALANSSLISEDVRRRVAHAVTELGYQPDRAARSLRTRQSRILGLIIPDIQNPFFIGVVRAVQNVADEHGFTVFLCNTDEDVAKEARCIESMQAERVAGILIAPAHEFDEPCRRLVESGLPVVVIDRRLAGVDVDTVVVDNAGATKKLVAHLISDGHTRIGAVLGSPVVTTGRERQEGYLRALAEHDLPVEFQFLQIAADEQINRDPVGYALTQALLQLPEPPSALFTSNNLLTIGALRAIRERGLSIPDDIALVAFDEIDWMSVFRPALSSIAQPVYELGETATELLLRRIADPSRPAQAVVLEPTIIIRQSCAHHPLPVEQSMVSTVEIG